MWKKRDEIPRKIISMKIISKVNLLWINFKKGAYRMTQSKRQKERQWKERKQSQNPHGKVKSFEQLVDGAGKGESENK